MVSEETENFLFDFITTKKCSLRYKNMTVVKTADYGNGKKSPF